MHYLLAVFCIIWFAFVAPPHVVALAAIGCFLIAASVRAIAKTVGGTEVSYAASIKAVFLAAILLSLSLLLLAGGMKNLTLVVMLTWSPITIPFILLGAYVLGFYLCLGTTFPASALVAFLSTIVSLGIIAGLKALV